MASTKAANNIKYLFWLYFWLLIFEGALRKWIFPQLSAPLLIIRDPVAIGAYFLAFQAGLFPRNIFTKIIIGLGFISSLAALATVIAFDYNLTVTLFGIRTNFLHLPLIFLFPKVFNLEDVKKLGRWILILAIPIAVLMVCQFNSPPDAFINRTAGLGDAQQLGSALGKIRTPGPFSYVTASAQYLSLVASFLLYGLVHSKTYPNWLLSSAGLSLVLALAVSGSRTVVASVGIVVIALGTALLIRPSLATKSYRFVIFAFMIGCGLSFIPYFNQGVEVLTSRIETASDHEASTGGFTSRFLRDFSEPFKYIGETPLLGYGLGMGTTAGAALLTGKGDFLLAEGEWGRVLSESGPVLGMLYILLRIALVCWMSWVCIKSASAGNVLPILLFGACGLLLLSGQFSRSSDIGFAVLGGGLCFASTKSVFSNSKQPDEDFIGRQLLT